MKLWKRAACWASTAITALLAVILACNVYTLAVRQFTDTLQPAVFGWSTAVVISGSMSGAIEVDDMVVIHEQPSYAVGDVITFENGNVLVTHRVIAMAGEEYVTKGDANNSPDTYPVAPEQVVGKVVLVIPRVGRAITALRSPLGMTVMLFVGLGLIAAPYYERRKEDPHA